MCELPIKMASLQIVEGGGMDEPECDYMCPGENTSVALSSPRRVLRKRITTPSASNGKRRCKLPPRKYSLNSIDGAPASLDDLATLYTSKGTLGNKSIKCLLETIYEEPVKQKNGSFISVGIKKMKRTITFSDKGCISKSKQRKRKARSKLLVNKWVPKRSGEKRASLDTLLSKLEADESRESNGSPHCTSTSCFNFPHKSL